MAPNNEILECLGQQITDAWSDSIITLVCFAIGIFVFRRRSSGQRACAAAADGRQPVKAGPRFEKDFARVPAELRGEVARAVGLAGTGACAAAGRELRRQFWDSHEVWHAIAGAHGVTVGELTKAAEARDAFRRSHFRIDGGSLQQLGGVDGPQVLQKAALVIQGLVRADGKPLAEATCDAAVVALRARDPTDPASAVAAERLLEAAHRRCDVVSAEQFGRLEKAANSALQLQLSVDQAIKEHLENMDVQAAAALDGLVDASPTSLSTLSCLNESAEEWVGGDQACDVILRELRASFRSV